ncbi:hypothetical protein DPMN_085155 [Dreissena polymorpha]|uniref:Uncharacterized protein n=1 Tax=Dreissena polymorpha TaxID=45954 RepID=A0A9D3YFN3_DREPO|nr:hypothetical protein DPMN_085155 [Dreissena polymorpha]
MVNLKKDRPWMEMLTMEKSRHKHSTSMVLKLKTTSRFITLQHRKKFKKKRRHSPGSNANQRRQLELHFVPDYLQVNLKI